MKGFFHLQVFYVHIDVFRQVICLTGNLHFTNNMGDQTALLLDAVCNIFVDEV